MQTQTCTWQGKIIAVNHHPDRCRVTIEFAGDLASTASFMKESAVLLEVLPEKYQMFGEPETGERKAG